MTKPNVVEVLNQYIIALFENDSMTKESFEIIREKLNVVLETLKDESILKDLNMVFLIKRRGGYKIESLIGKCENPEQFRAFIFRLRWGFLALGKEFYDLCDDIIDTREKKYLDDNKNALPHYNLPKMNVEKAERLYDTLVEGKYLIDTGKNDFVYFFTGLGKKAKKKLIWNRDNDHPAVILGVLLSKLFAPKGVSWKDTYNIFDNIPKNMDVSLARTKKRHEEHSLRNYSYKRHEKLVSSWLVDK